MEFNKKQPALLYLDKKGFYYYQSGLQNIISLAFLETSVKDMEIINGISIMNQIKTFVEQYQISPATITIIVSPNVTFEKGIVGLEMGERDEQVKKFIDTIPFESVLSKSYPIEKGVKVMGINEDLYVELKISFEKCSFSIENVIPYQLLGNDQALIQNLTAENASQLLKKIGNLKQYTLLNVEKEKTQNVNNSSTNAQTGTKPKKSNIRLYLMIGVFVILFAILGFMLFKK